MDIDEPKHRGQCIAQAAEDHRKNRVRNQRFWRQPKDPGVIPSDEQLRIAASR